MITFIDLLAAGVTDSSGNPISSGTVTSYRAGTTTLANLYQDFGQEDEHPNPLTLDAYGRVKAYADGRVKLVIKDSSGATVSEIDHVGIEDSDVVGSGVSDLAGDGLTADSDGVLSVNVDGSSVSIVNDVVGIPDRGITRDKIVEPGHQLSSSSGSFSTTSSTYVDVTNLSVTLTTHGNPVLLLLVPTTSASYVKIAGNPGSIDLKYVRTTDGSDTDVTSDIRFAFNYSSSITAEIPPGGFGMVDIPAAGQHTYKVQVKRNGNTTAGVQEVKLFAVEL